MTMLDVVRVPILLAAIAVAAVPATALGQTAGPLRLEEPGLSRLASAVVFRDHMPPGLRSRTGPRTSSRCSS